MMTNKQADAVFFISTILAVCLIGVSFFIGKTGIENANEISIGIYFSALFVMFIAMTIIALFY